MQDRRPGNDQRGERQENRRGSFSGKEYRSDNYRRESRREDRRESRPGRSFSSRREEGREDRWENRREDRWENRREDRRENRRENRADRDQDRRRADVDTRFFSGETEPDENRIEGRNAVIEAYRAGRTIEKLFLLEGPAEGAMQTVLRLAKDHNTPVRFLTRQRLDQLSQTGRHQGVIAQAAAFRYAEIDDLFARAAEKGEDPFFVLLDQIEDPHNLGAIIRTANLAGAHGVIIPKDRSVGLTATAAKASAGAIHYTPVVKVTNLARTMEDLKKRGLWFVCADMDGTPMTRLSMTGPIGLVIGAEGSGVSRLVREKCDMTASIPMKGEIDSLNASVAAGVLMYEILRQRG